MILDERSEFNARTTIPAGMTAWDEINTEAAGIQSGYAIGLLLIVHSASGTVSATLQESNDGATWSDIVTYPNLPVGRISGGYLPTYSKARLRILWNASGTAVVSAALTPALISNT